MGVDTPCLHELDRVDDATAYLILQLHNRDIEELLHASKGKGQDDERSDADLAITTYQKELQKWNTILADRCMAQSLTQAIISDAVLLRESLVEENAATEDRALAHHLAGINAPSAASEQSTAGHTLDDGFLARLTALYVSGGNDESYTSEDTTDADSTAAAESSASAASRQKISAAIHRQCTACDLNKPLFDIFQTPCGHHYCQECLRTLFELSTTDETLFPPRCCRQEIPLQSVKIYLSPALLRTFALKSIEFKTSDRTYCCRPACSSFITSVNITGERATCTACGTHTCTICKNNAHDGDCPEDTATQQVLETAREQGWQRCYNCRRLIELDVGCNHMVYAPLWKLFIKCPLTWITAVPAVHNSGNSPSSCFRAAY